MSATTQRDKAIHFSPSQWEAALAAARHLADPYFRCQGLAWAARFAPEEKGATIAAEALEAAFAANDSYRTVAASAWAIRALVETRREAAAERWLPRLLSAAQRIENPVSRADAQFLLYQAVYPGKTNGKESLLNALISACFAADSWKGGYILRDVALIRAQDSPEQAARIIASMPEGIYKRQAARRLSAKQVTTVREFFWYHP